MKEIYGNNFLISIAYHSKSPTQAADQTELAGYSTEEIKAVRAAAVFKRDMGEEKFKEKYSPYELMDVVIEENFSMRINFKFDQLYKTRGLNNLELSRLATIIENQLSILGLMVSIERKDTIPQIKSTI